MTANERPQGLEVTTGEAGTEGTPPVTWAFPGKFISVTTHRRDGTAVATPVWFVQQGDRLLVRTGSESGKVKRIRRDPAVQVATCSANGRVQGQPASGVARVLTGQEADAAERLIDAKYRLELLVIRPAWFIQSTLHLGHPRSAPLVLAITPS